MELKEKNVAQNINTFTFQLINENSVKQNQLCLAITFNKDYSIVLAGCNNEIKIFQHMQGKLNQIQLLNKHTNHVTTLNFMSNNNNFVSGSHDNSIIIWQVIGDKQWDCQQKLDGHQNYIFCLLLNNFDDLIISGSHDTKIKFWIKKDKWQCQQTITDHTNSVYSLSLNEQQNELISCSHDLQILVIESKKSDKQWSVTQKIKLDIFGFRLCFINDRQFTYQPYFKEQMYIYERDSNSNQYKKIKEIFVKFGSFSDDCLFPQQFIKSKCLLVNKNGQNVNLIRKKENGDFLIEKFIEFDTYNIFGQLSNDGEFLITWDNGSNEIQIRKFRE